MEKDKLEKLRLVITENTRIQQAGATAIEYVDVSGALGNIAARQNHVVFGRRGCGKTLLLQSTSKKADTSIRTVYINCEDYKQHSFPNVLIEILDRVFGELEANLSGWFGRKAKVKTLLEKIRTELRGLKETPDHQTANVRQISSTEGTEQASAVVAAKGLQIGAGESTANREAIEKVYRVYDSKIEKLNLLLPKMKAQIKEFFATSSKVKAVFIELDDFYHLPKSIQPHIADYIHRLCKDVPLYFKLQLCVTSPVSMQIEAASQRERRSAMIISQ